MKELTVTIEAKKVNTIPDDRNTLSVEIEVADISEIIGALPDEDLEVWISQNRKPEDIFTEKQLEEWANNNGFTPIAP
jgi:hypothetical protein